MTEYHSKIQELNSAIQQLCRINYSAVDLYKEIMDIAKQQQNSNAQISSQQIIYTIIDQIEYFLSNSDFDITSYERLMQDNLNFLEQWNLNKSQLSQLKDSLSWIQEISNKSFHSPSNLSLIQSKSHSRIVSSFVDEPRNSKELNLCKTSFLTKNPSFINCNENQGGKSRNQNQNTLSSRTLVDTDRYASRHIKDQSSINQFDRKVFMTAENQKRKLDTLDEKDLEYLTSSNLEKCKDVIISFLRDYDIVCNEVVTMKEQNPNMLISNKVFEICSQSSNRFMFEDTLCLIDQIITNNSEDLKKVERLLENLSVMILSNQKNGNIDPEAWNLIQKLFGDKALVKILRHIDSNKRDKSAPKKTTKKQVANYNKSLVALRKIMMQIEMNVSSREQFLLDEAENEITQGLFIKALSMVDKLIMGIKTTTISKSNSRSQLRDNSTNKSNSEWDTKSISCDKTIFDIDSKSAIQVESNNSKKDDNERTEDVDTIQSYWNIKRSISLEESHKGFNSNPISKAQNNKPFIKNLFRKESSGAEVKCPEWIIEKEDYLSMMHLQASHVENLVLYIEDMNEALSKQ